MNEHQFKQWFYDRFEDLLKAHGIEHIRLATNPNLLQGIPDRVYTLDTRTNLSPYVYFEFKKHRNAAKQANQDWWIDFINNKLHAKAYFVSPQNYNFVLEDFFNGI